MLTLFQIGRMVMQMRDRVYHGGGRSNPVFRKLLTPSERDSYDEGKSCEEIIEGMDSMYWALEWDDYLKLYE